MKDDIYTSTTLHYFGFMNMQCEKWKIAEEYLDQAIQYCQKDSFIYRVVLHRKILCIAKSRKFVKAKKLLKETKSIYSACKTFSIYFEALGHYVNVSRRVSLYNNDSADYIETIALPHFIENSNYFLAVEYYKLLEAYNKVKNNKKSLQMSAEIRKIYERCLF